MNKNCLKKNCQLFNAYSLMRQKDSFSVKKKCCLIYCNYSWNWNKHHFHNYCLFFGSFRHVNRIKKGVFELNYLTVNT